MGADLDSVPLLSLAGALLRRVVSHPVVAGLAAAIVLAVALWAGARALGLLRPLRSLQGRSVLVTGAATGLGRELALAFGRQGARVILWDIDAEGMAETFRQLGPAAALAQRVDVSDRRAVYAAAEEALRSCGGRVDCVVNNAGILGGRPLLEADDDRVHKVFEVNALALFWTTKAFLPAMIKAGDGHIVTVASGAALVGVPNSADYSASKHAARGFNESLRQELQKHGVRGVRTLCVFPGIIETAMAKGYKLPGVPVLRPASVAEKVVESVRAGDYHLYLPFATLLGLYNVTLLPVGIFDYVGRAFGASNVADSWDSSQQDRIYATLSGKQE
eukprot:TRINITY_DN17027_c0_g1_i1.p1 TRINITY_DN17027_c0_g1~~TRINITY_DN17027_c0_g1_i1.p1  ORF type:complete len:358 (+),score=93.84 TRINITY_DN17027_c0_g1_i1:78-1076(+)